MINKGRHKFISHLIYYQCIWDARHPLINNIITAYIRNPQLLVNFTFNMMLIKHSRCKRKIIKFICITPQVALPSEVRLYKYIYLDRIDCIIV